MIAAILIILAFCLGLVVAVLFTKGININITAQEKQKEAPTEYLKQPTNQLPPEMVKWAEQNYGQYDYKA